MARALATVVLIRARYFPLVVSRDDLKYFEVLRADEGRLIEPVEYFSQLQKRALTKAISRIADLKPVESLEEALNVTRDLLINAGRTAPRE